MKCIICHEKEVKDFERVCDTCMAVEKELDRYDHEMEMSENE
jgi:hypothetical protein